MQKTRARKLVDLHREDFTQQPQALRCLMAAIPLPIFHQRADVVAAGFEKAAEMKGLLKESYIFRFRRRQPCRRRTKNVTAAGADD